MFSHRPRVCRSALSGLTRTEILVLIVVIAVLLAVLLGPVRSYFYLHGVDRAVESARELNTLLAQYATDNNDVYPVGEGTRAPGTSEGIALDLLLNQFTPNADIFAVGSTPRYAGTEKDYADLTAANISWDFTAGETTTTGITADASALLPVLYTTGETVSYQPGQSLTLSGRGPFGTRHFIVAYKAGNIFCLQASQNGVLPSFVPPDFKSTGTYTQIRP